MKKNIAQPNSENNLSKRHSFILPTLKAHLTFWLLAAAGLILDLWSKSAVFSWLEQKPINSVSIIQGFLHLVRTENPGALFGMFPGHAGLFIAVSVVALITIFAIFLFSRDQHILFHIALALFAAGVCGNLYDRIFNGGLVRDFIDVVYYPGRHWPAFNVADAMLCIGVGLLIFTNFVTAKSARTRAQQHK